MQRDRRNYLSIRRTVGTDELRPRRAHMARGMIGLAMVVILTAMLPSPAGAQPVPPVQNMCWTLSPFVDTVLMEITQGDQVFNLNGRLRANAAAGQQAAGGAGPAVYQLLGAGTATPSVTTGNTVDVGFQAVHNTPFFGGNRGCNFYAEVNTLSFNGTWTLQCPGPTLFTRQGTLTNVSPCPGNF
jgi:hypothetical protein